MSVCLCHADAILIKVFKLINANKDAAKQTSRQMQEQKGEKRISHFNNLPPSCLANDKL